MSTQQSIQDLRKNGFTVRVNHVRNFENVAVDTEDGFDHMLTRGEFTRAVESDNLRYVEYDNDGEVLNDYFAEADEVVYGKQVNPKGGFTTVTIEKDGETVARGKFSFKSSSAFVKSIGLNAAFGRAVKQLSH
jgi:hypothetical protein